MCRYHSASSASATERTLKSSTGLVKRTMRRLLLILASIGSMGSIGLAGSVTAPLSQTASVGDVAFTNARVLSSGPGIDSIQTPQMTIVVRGGKVVAFDRAAKIPP